MTGVVQELPPAARVLDAFGVRGVPEPLSGGMKTVWRIGNAVFKWIDMPSAVMSWQAEILAQVDGCLDFRVAPPLRARTGELVVQGWTAWRYEPGVVDPCRWRDVIAAGDAFHDAVRDVARPLFLQRRRDRWAVGDRVAWGERTPGGYDLASLRRALRPLNAPAQLIHGDLSTNVLFAVDAPPLVLDLSPYWRPPPFAAAVVVVDALTVEGVDVFGLEARGPGFAQYLLRALIFRIVSDRGQDADFYRRAIGVALALT